MKLSKTDTRFSYILPFYFEQNPRKKDIAVNQNLKRFIKLILIIKQSQWPAEILHRNKCLYLLLLGIGEDKAEIVFQCSDLTK